MRAAMLPSPVSASPCWSPSLAGTRPIFFALENAPRSRRRWPSLSIAGARPAPRRQDYTRTGSRQKERAAQAATSEFHRSRLLLLRFAVGVNHRARAIALGPEDHLARPDSELLQIVRHDVLELREQGPRLRPLAVLAEGDVAQHGREPMRMDVLREPAVVEAAGFLHGRCENLTGRIAEGREGVAEGIDLLAGR